MTLIFIFLYQGFTVTLVPEGMLIARIDCKEANEANHPKI